MSCVPWQLLQLGAEESPETALRPCMLAANCFCSSAWQSPHSTFASLSGCGSSLMSEWHEEQSAEAWGEAWSAAAWKGGASPALRLPVLGPFSWHEEQSSEVIFAGSSPTSAAASAKSAAPARKRRARRRVT